MGNPLPCLRRTEPSAALIPQSGHRTLAYVPVARSDIRERIQEFNRFTGRPMRRLNGDGAPQEFAHVPA